MKILLHKIIKITVIIISSFFLFSTSLVSAEKESPLAEVFSLIVSKIDFAKMILTINANAHSNNNILEEKGVTFSWPVVGDTAIIQGFQPGHYAIDIWGPNNPEIKSIGAGTVIRAAYDCAPRSSKCQGGYGNLVVIDHGGGYKGVYAHNSVVYVSVGDRVTAGQVIAKMGNSGNTRGRTGIQLHLELSFNGRKVDPLHYLLNE